MLPGVLIFAIVGLVALISFQNVSAVSLFLLHWRFETTLPVVIFISILTGVVVAQLVRQWAAGRRFKSNEP